MSSNHSTPSKLPSPIHAARGIPWPLRDTLAAFQTWLSRALFVGMVTFTLSSIVRRVAGEAAHLDNLPSSSLGAGSLGPPQQNIFFGQAQQEANNLLLLAVSHRERATQTRPHQSK